MEGVGLGHAGVEGPAGAGGVGELPGFRVHADERKPAVPPALLVDCRSRSAPRGASARARATRNFVPMATRRRGAYALNSAHRSDRPSPDAAARADEPVADLSAALSITPVHDERTAMDWLAVPFAVFAGDPAWVPPLNFIERRRISRSHAPFFTFVNAEHFLEYLDYRPVWRI